MKEKFRPEKRRVPETGDSAKKWRVKEEFRLDMKIFMLFFLLYLISCQQKAQEKNNMLGNDYRLFEKTPVWNIAKAALKNDTAEIVRIFKNKKVNLNFQEPKFGQTLLMLSVVNQQISVCRTLLKLGADVNVHNLTDGASAIIDAAGEYTETSSFLKLLLRNGANPNDLEVGDRKNGSQQRKTPLLSAAGESVEKVRILVEAGADINFKNEFGASPLTHSIRLNQFDVAHYLLIHGADFSVPVLNREGKNYYIVDILKEKFFPVTTKKYDEKMKVVDFLQKHGVDYRKIPAPESVVTDLKRMYPSNWQEVLDKY